jgi:hypothetical protein
MRFELQNLIQHLHTGVELFQLPVALCARKLSEDKAVILGGWQKFSFKHPVFLKGVSSFEITIDCLKPVAFPLCLNSLDQVLLEIGFFIGLAGKFGLRKAVIVTSGALMVLLCSNVKAEAQGILREVQ